ncbi:hypothetical protein Zmor_007015 [Zophobas morio]|uniref:Uncharacterized protein n=1 Tax=Zophobas morio TaxID=2755281 RepID=A0AA38MNY2_9CUCU|nr:hypothetical protein Zmor_007015 [Zophobas morio]
MIIQLESKTIKAAKLLKILSVVGRLRVVSASIGLDVGQHRRVHEISHPPASLNSANIVDKISTVSFLKTKSRRRERH